MLEERAHIPGAMVGRARHRGQEARTPELHHHLLSQFRFARTKPPITFQRERREHYSRQAVPAQMLVPRSIGR